MTISIFKFGGSCFKDYKAFQKIKNIIELHKNQKLIFVASALQGITDLLVKVTQYANNPEELDNTINEILNKHMETINFVFKDNSALKSDAESFINMKIEELTEVLSEIEEFGPEAYFTDYILSFGEKMSTYLLYLFVKSLGYEGKYLTGEDFIITDSNFGNCLPKWDLTVARIKKIMIPKLEKNNINYIFCCTGFIGRNKIGYTTTLGRGGSDFTATIIARALYDVCDDKDIRVVLWKDVNGILATNPKYVSNPKLIRFLNYDEAKEMAFYGAKILHPKCLVGLDERHIPVEIRPFDHPESDTYSVIGDKSIDKDITAISTIEDISLLTVTSSSLVSTPGVLAKIFTIMGDNDINVSMVAQSSSEVNTTFIVSKEDGKKAKDLIDNNDFFKGWASVDLSRASIIAITGKGIAKANTQSKIFEKLGSGNIEIIALAQSSDGLNLSLVVRQDLLKKAVSLLHEGLYEL
ncbi:MAG: aspartate kinase [Promethearchaeota archaeon]